ncbi:MAG: hypothetical protein IJ400_05665 [Clostridia bacterium]|nr:hypothetical protein [Clostridia bacterium]
MPIAFTENEFLKHVDEVNKINYVYGNEVLYKSFNFSIMPHPSDTTYNVGKLSSAIWIIGKAYSADPTRSATSLVKSEGLGLSFDKIANSIVNHPDYKKLYDKLDNLNSKTYSFTFGHDISILNDCVYCVNLLNNMIKDSMGDGSENVVSFCSKFLHFMCPNVFFIIDSLSLAGGIGLYSGRVNRIFQVETVSSSDWLEITDSERNFLKSKLSIQNANASYDEPIKTYYNHCVRCYSLATYLNSAKKKCEPQIIGVGASTYMPRLVDSILIRIK